MYMHVVVFVWCVVTAGYVAYMVWMYTGSNPNPDYYIPSPRYIVTSHIIPSKQQLMRKGNIHIST